jgi:hypothetical protein
LQVFSAAVEALHPGAHIRRPVDLDQLVETIAAFGVAKQLRRSHRTSGL